MRVREREDWSIASKIKQNCGLLSKDIPWGHLCSSQPSEGLPFVINDCWGLRELMIRFQGSIEKEEWSGSQLNWFVVWGGTSSDQQFFFRSLSLALNQQPSNPINKHWMTISKTIPTFRMPPEEKALPSFLTNKGASICGRLFSAHPLNIGIKKATKGAGA